jgi:hypothetical protein
MWLLWWIDGYPEGSGDEKLIKINVGGANHPDHYLTSKMIRQEKAFEARIIKDPS